MAIIFLGGGGGIKSLRPRTKRFVQEDEDGVEDKEKDQNNPPCDLPSAKSVVKKTFE